MGPAGQHSERSAIERLAERHAAHEYDELVADMLRVLPAGLVATKEAQAVIRYFSARIRKRFAEEFLAKL